MSKGPVVALLLVLLPFSAQAADWVPISRGDDGAIVYAEKESLSRTGNVVKVWTKLLLAKPEKSPSGSHYQSSRALSLYDCKAGTSAHKQRTYFQEANLTGEMVDSVSTTDAQLVWQEIAPDTFGESMLKWVCANAPKVAAK